MESNTDSIDNIPNGKRSDIVIYLIMGVFFLFIMFPVFLIVILGGGESEWVYFGFIDAYYVIAIFLFVAGIYGFYACRREIRAYKRKKEK